MAGSEEENKITIDEIEYDLETLSDSKAQIANIQPLTPR